MIPEDEPAVDPWHRHPWLAGDLELSRAVLDAVDAHAIAEYPNESCGFLLGPAADVRRVDTSVRAVNLADKYHAADPETFPRTAHEFYMIDARLIQRTFDRGEDDGHPVKAIYHSHCDCGAYFSQEDQSGAAPDGILSYPVAYFVTSVRNGVVDDHKLFTFRAGAWIEVPFRVA